MEIEINYPEITKELRLGPFRITLIKRNVWKGEGLTLVCNFTCNGLFKKFLSLGLLRGLQYTTKLDR